MTEKRSTPELFFTPKTKEGLIKACQKKSYINNHIRLCPGWLLKQKDKEAVYGQYGLQRLFPKTNEVIANLGFSIEDGCIIVTNSPQGKRRSKLSEEALESFNHQNRDFRNQMMQEIIEIAKRANFKKILALPAAGTPAVTSQRDDIDYYQIVELTDRIYESLGFKFDSETAYWTKDL